MPRPTAFFSLFNVLKTASAGAIVLAAAIACSDTNSPKAEIVRVHVDMVSADVPDSVKDRLAAEAAAGANMVPMPAGPLANVVVSPKSGASDVAGSCSGGGGFLGYTKSRVAFDPEPIPTYAPFPLKDEGFIPDTQMPLGFNFTFEGNTYSGVNVYSNGFLLFGPPPSTRVFYPDALSLPANIVPKNIIALAWSDWDPSLVPDAIRFETRGEAPNRRFILQYTNVPEYKGQGLLMAQVVLSEGSNDITIYTNTMSTTIGSHFVTQAIENADGTVASFDSVMNPVNGIVSPRNRNFFKLTNDALRFSPVLTKDEVKPTIDVPQNVTAFNDPGLPSAVVTVAPPSAHDDCAVVQLVGVRDDGKNLSDPFPVGVTTVTWTAQDAALNSASVAQTITVIDNEAPVFSRTALSIMSYNATSPNGAVVTFDRPVTDNVGVTSFVCDPASGSVFSNGPHTVKCTASDAAGNSATDYFSVNVIDAHHQLFNLLDYVRGLGLPNGTAQPVINQLSAAYSQGSVDQSCKKLGDFMSMVEKKNSNIPGDASSLMLVEANRIMGAMGCSLSARSSLFVSPSSH